MHVFWYGLAQIFVYTQSVEVLSISLDRKLANTKYKNKNNILLVKNPQLIWLHG